MGCGRLGSTLAHKLDALGHTVAVIDQNSDAFRRLGAEFSGTTVTGIGFDRDVLRSAGIERADAFAAVSSGDNSNIIAARVARETFGIEQVVARIYDPGRAEVYQRLGITTVATVKWTADQVLRRLLPAGAEPDFRDPSGTIRLDQVPASEPWIGERTVKFQEQSKCRIAWIDRLGEGMLPTRDSVIQEGDLLHLVLRRLLPAGAEPDFRDPSGTIRVDHMLVPDNWVGQRTIHFQEQTKSRIAWIDRLGEGMLPTRETIIQEGDLVHLVMREENAGHAYTVIDKGPEGDY